MTQPDWAALAVPFPPEEVKQRPGAATYDHKPSCDGAKCRETRDPAKHHQFDYVDARAVAQRLDDVLTPAGWQFVCHVITGDVVAGRLSIRVDDEWIAREDHGYPNSERDEEPVKAATSDALKRCAVLFGVGRHLYGDNTPRRRSTTQGAVSSSAAPQAAGRPLRPAATTTPPEPDYLAESLGGAPERPQTASDEGTCPIHHREWKKSARGFYCSAKNADGTWCDEHPTQRWVQGR